jgi:hypothetical protein
MHQDGTYAALRSSYDLIAYPMPDDLREVLGREDYGTLARLATAVPEDRQVFEAVALALAPALLRLERRFSEIIHKQDLRLLELLWDVLRKKERPLENPERPDLEIEGRIRGRLAPKRRKEARRGSLLPLVPGANLTTAPAPAADLDLKLDMQELLERLSPAYRQAIEKGVLEGMTEGEIGKALGKSPKAAERQKNRALERARQLYHQPPPKKPKP